jgi:hypothetical protein
MPLFSAISGVLNSPEKQLDIKSCGLERAISEAVALVVANGRPSTVVDTGISNSERNLPAELADSNPEAEQYSDRIRQAIKSGKLSAADIARITIDAVKNGRFYILTHPNVRIAVEIRMNDILLDRQPTNTSRS